MSDLAKEKKICLTIAGVDPSGGAGILADVRTFSAFGCFPTSAITSITFQNTQGVFGVENQTAETVRRQIEPILDDYDIAAVKTGMLPTKEIIEEIAKIAKERDLKKLVVDPVVRSTSGYDLIDNRALRALIENLFPIAEIITPNIPEAERIAGCVIKTLDDIKVAAGRMSGFGAKSILIKGGHFQEDLEEKRIARDYLFTGGKLEVLDGEYFDTTSTHGTGCVLASAITANMAFGKDIFESCRIAKEFVNTAIRNSPNHGKGHSPIGI